MLKIIMTFLPRYDFGDYNTKSKSTGTPYMQLLSTIDATTVGPEAVSTRAKTLLGMSPEIPPSQLLQLLLKQEASSNSSVELSNSSTPSPGPDSTTQGELKQYAIIAIGLLGANLIVGLALLGMGVVRCMRGRGGGGGKLGVAATGAAGAGATTRYAAVPVKFPGESDGHGAGAGAGGSGSGHYDPYQGW